jgi:hypothetical protein
MRVILELVAVCTLIFSCEGLHHNGKRTFTGRMSPTLSRLRDAMHEKMSQLGHFVTGEVSNTSSSTMTTTLAPATATPIKGDGEDIAALL